MKSRTVLIALMTAIIVTSLASFAAVNFQDVLETPAARSTHAARTLLIGVALAGKRIVGVGQHGHIVYSDDQGKSWTQATVPVSSDLLAVHFPTPQKGWAVGHDGVVLHSADGGATWSKQFDGRAAARLMVSSYSGSTAAARPAAGGADTPTLAEEIQKISDQGPDKPFLDVWFENETTGFVVGAFSLIFRTTDGGKSWTPWYDKIDNPKRYHLYSIRPVSGELFLTSEQGTVFKLDQKSGRFVATKTPYTGTFFGITGKPGALVAFGMRGNAFRSRDGGASWQKVETGVPVGLMGATVTEDGRIVLVSQGGHVLVSSDDGTSFAQIKVEQQSPAFGVAAVDKSTIALVGQRGARVHSIR
jgi:photosystem II stability/assembly factor-like uncharacterized protein